MCDFNTGTNLPGSYYLLMRLFFAKQLALTVRFFLFITVVDSGNFSILLVNFQLGEKD